MTDPGFPTIPGYAIEKLVGRGGMAEVFRARALSGRAAGQTVALKRLLPSLGRDAEFVTMLRHEAELTRRVRHPTIVEVYETGVEDGIPFLVMEYVDGRNLKEILAQCAARKILLPVDFGAYVAHVIAQALAHAHEGWDDRGHLLGVVHNDVSPSNVFISRLGEIKLGDFGVARLLPGSPQVLITPDVEEGGSHGAGAFGKIQYLAPEVIRGGRPTPASDLFALGAVLFELLTNQRAFPGREVNEVGQKILSGERRVPSSIRADVPPALDGLVLSCLQVEPGRRVPTASAFSATLAQSYDPAIGTPLAIAAVVRGLFGTQG